MSPASSKGERSRWTILALISVSHIIGAAAQYGINTLAPFYQHDLQLSRAQIGLFFTAFYSGMAGLSYAAGWLVDRLGVRGTVLSGHLALGLWTIAAAAAPSFGWAFGSFFLAGLGYAFLNPASTKGVMAWFYRDERATAMGIKQTGVPAGGVVAAVLGPSLVLLAGWRGALALTQIGGMVGRIGWGVVSDRLFRGKRKIVLVVIGVFSVALTLCLGLLPPAASLFILLPLIFLAGLCMVGYQGVSYALIGEIAGKAQTGAALGIVITINSLGAIFGTPLFGYVVDATGSYSIAWQLLSGAILIGIAALTFFLKEPGAEVKPTI